MLGAELVIGYLAAWAVRKARRVGERLDSEADAAIDAGLDRLHGLIVDKLGDDPALERFKLEAQTHQVAERTRTRVMLALEDAADDDEGFAAKLEEVVTALQQAGAEGVSFVAISQSAQGTQNVQLADVHGTVSINIGGQSSGATE